MRLYIVLLPSNIIPHSRTFFSILSHVQVSWSRLNCPLDDILANQFINTVYKFGWLWFSEKGCQGSYECGPVELVVFKLVTNLPEYAVNRTRLLYIQKMENILSWSCSWGIFTPLPLQSDLKAKSINFHHLTSCLETWSEIPIAEMKIGARTSNAIHTLQWKGRRRMPLSLVISSGTRAVRSSMMTLSLKSITWDLCNVTAKGPEQRVG